jgi:hypothetical protein
VLAPVDQPWRESVCTFVDPKRPLDRRRDEGVNLVFLKHKLGSSFTSTLVGAARTNACVSETQSLGGAP